MHIHITEIENGFVVELFDSSLHRTLSVKDFDEVLQTISNFYKKQRGGLKG